jgi:hypothetical protein
MWGTRFPLPPTYPAPHYQSPPMLPCRRMLPTPPPPKRLPGTPPQRLAAQPPTGCSPRRRSSDDPHAAVSPMIPVPPAPDSLSAAAHGGSPCCHPVLLFPPQSAGISTSSPGNVAAFRHVQRASPSAAEPPSCAISAWLPVDGW